jgi:4a-hydroxytetrahydrobiopterin dehydratase
MADCAPGIQERDHHPEWTNVYDRVSVRLNTHDAGGMVTAKDVEVAKFLDWMFQASPGGRS